MTGITTSYVLCEHLFNGQVVVGRYDHVARLLWIGEEPASLAEWYCLEELAQIRERAPEAAA